MSDSGTSEGANTLSVQSFPSEEFPEAIHPRVAAGVGRGRELEAVPARGEGVEVALDALAAEGIGRRLRSTAKKGAHPVTLRLTPPFYGPSARNGRQTDGAMPGTVPCTGPRTDPFLSIRSGTSLSPAITLFILPFSHRTLGSCVAGHQTSCRRSPNLLLQVLALCVTGPSPVCLRSAFLRPTCDAFRSSVHSAVAGPKEK